MTGVHSQRPIQQPLHRGSVLASGLVIDTTLVTELAARRRILELPLRGTRVFRRGTFLIVIFQAPIRMDCSMAMGAPLVRQGRLLSSAPLRPEEQKRLEFLAPSSAPSSAPSASVSVSVSLAEAVVLVVGGNVATFHLDDLERQEISSWIDLSEFCVVRDIVSLGEVMLEPKSASPPTKTDVRGSLGLTPLTADAQQVVDVLMQRHTRHGTKSHTTHHTTQGSTEGRRAERRWSAATIGGALSQLWRIIKEIAQRARSEQPARFGDRRELPSHDLAFVQDAERRPYFWLRSIREVLSRFAERALLWSRLSSLVGRRHADYLARMLEMFDSNQLDDALRHAIPLTSKIEAALRPAPFRTLSPRTDLAIVPAQASASTSLALGGNLFELLRQRYRRAFERLAARGEIEKAAFVLAELLEANEEAISFLEQHDRLELAAEIAEARKLPPGLVIRLCFLAGQRDRALRVARLTGAFADAVLRLERTHHDEAQALRLLWGDALASGGAYSAAVEVVWPVAGARNLARAWLERAIEVGGPTGARMLARKARLAPAEFAEVRERVLRLLEDDQSAGLCVQALGRELIAGEATPETRALAKATVRRLLRDAEDRDTDRLIQRLLEVSGDAALRADVRASRFSSETSSGDRSGHHGRRQHINVRAFACTREDDMRPLNRDACLLSFLDADSKPRKSGAVGGDAASQGLALAVFDGKSGWAHKGVPSAAGQIASDAVVASLRNSSRTNGSDAEQWARSLPVSLQHANRALLKFAAATPDHHGTTATATVATLCGAKLIVAQIGDTRGYVLRGEELLQVTRDHFVLDEYMASMRAQGTPMTQEQIDEFPHKRLITRVLGMREEIAVDITQVEIEDGDVILLCSDGLWSTVDEDRIRRTLTKGHSPQATCDALFSMALEAGARDDIAIVVASVQGKGLSRARSAIACEPFVPSAIDETLTQRATPLASRSTPVEIRRTAADRGTMKVLDATLLPDGRMLVALGEMGVWLISREGKVLTQFSEPTHRLVISDHGDRAILLARRGETFRVSRLDLIAKRVRPWCDARFAEFAPDFDGSIWFVARGDTVYAIDATEDRWEHVWKVDERGTRVATIRRNSKTACFWLVQEATNGEVWTFEQPWASEPASFTLRLRQRQSMEKDAARFLVGSISGSGEFTGWHAQPEDDLSTGAHSNVLSAKAFIRGCWKDLSATTTAFPDAPHVIDGWIALPVVDDGCTMIHLFDTEVLDERARIRLDGSVRDVGLRFQDDHLLVFDGFGVVLVVSLSDGSIVREHRIA